jgi:ureidoglycolate lyase
VNTAAPAQRELHLPLETATVENMRAFGALLSRDAGGALTGLDYYRGAVAISKPVSFESATAPELSLAALRLRPFRVHYLERHFQHTQSFIPLGGKPWIAVLAPPNDADMPDLDAARAFRFEGHQGLCMHVGAWHEFPFPVEDETDMVVLLSTQTSQDLRTRSTNGIEAFGPDLDKKDMTLRAGVTLVIDV